MSQQVFTNRYEIQRHLARGGMAEVYLARDLLLDRPVALKVLFPELSADESFVARFRREAQAAANLNHPNIVSVYDWGEEGSTYFIVMEYVEGPTLRDLIRSDQRLGPDRAAEIAAEIAAALAFAHTNGVVHRDVKPGNVLITNTGQVKVTDFGIARAAADSAQESLTQTGTVMGTATYFSPEQAQGLAIDPRSDVYSLGVVLYETLVGRPPFSGPNAVSIAYQHVREMPPAPRSLNRDIPPPLEAIVLKAMAKNPGDRYASAADLRADLLRFREGRTVEAEVLPPAAATTQVQPAYDGTRQVTAVTMPAAAPPPRSRTGAYIALLVILLLVLAGLLVLFARELGVGNGSGETVAVPQVLGKQVDEAIRLLDGAGLDADREDVENDTAEEGVVFDSEPKPGEKVDEGTTVVLRVSAGASAVPVGDVVGLSADDARRLLERAGFVVDLEEEPNDEVPAGEVTEQDPAPGTELRRGDTVVLTVSGGPENVEIPDVVGKDLVEAVEQLAAAGFRTTREFKSSGEPKDTVISTDPERGTKAPKGTTVTVVVSSGDEETTTTAPEETTTTSIPPDTTVP
jgi:beta-lactam-binding protein with PASTA domain/predicted Ser/Thr protein kinase